MNSETSLAKRCWPCWAPYRSGPSKVWFKSKNPASEAVRREREEEWR
jgi:hypothetical protein